MPALPGDSKSTVVGSVKEFSDASMMELTDSEVQAAVKEILAIQQRYQYRQATKANLNALADEVQTKMYELGILVTFDPTPMLTSGDAPHLEILGKIADEHKAHGFDHEREQWEVQKANQLGQDVYDEKG